MRRTRSCTTSRLSVVRLLVLLQLLDEWRELLHDLVGTLVVLHLSRDELGKVSERLRCIEDLFRKSASLFWALRAVRAEDDLTFFITPSASSVCATNSSSLFSISALADSIAGDPASASVAEADLVFATPLA